jgi:hypothetical protein
MGATCERPASEERRPSTLGVDRTWHSKPSDLTLTNQEFDRLIRLAEDVEWCVEDLPTPLDSGSDIQDSMWIAAGNINDRIDEIIAVLRGVQTRDDLTAITQEKKI